jgi:uncharacterized protein (DUF1697 family)
MTVTICLLRGVNVGGHNKIPMAGLRELCGSLGLKDAQTLIQSGNVVFRTPARKLPKLAEEIAEAIERAFGFRPGVVLRTAAEWREAMARNPFEGREGVEPGKLLVFFLASEPSEEGRTKARAIPAHPDQMHMEARELFVYFPNGMGKAKLSMAAVERAMRVAGTGRNWNTVMKLMEMADDLD